MKQNPFDKFLTHEDKLQIAVIEYLKLQYPKAVYHHSPNEGRRSNFEKYKASKLGLKSGFPDLLIFHNGKSIAIELKTDTDKIKGIKRGKVSENQADWIFKLRDSGIDAHVAYGFNNAKLLIDTAFRSL